MARRPTGESKAADFLPCTCCLGFFQKDNLWAHSKVCIGKDADTPPASISASQRMLSPYKETQDCAVNNIFIKMKTTAANPGLEDIARSDELIRDYCRSLLQRLGDDTEQRIKDKDNIRTKLRTIAKLLKALNQRTPRWQSLAHFISGPCFDLLVSTTKDLAAQADSPSIAIRLGFAIKQIALLKLSKAIKTGDPLMELEAKQFQCLFTAHWSNQVACVANRRQRLRRINRDIQVPLTSDLVAFTTWLSNELVAGIKRPPTATNVQLVCKLLMTRIIIFNKRRPAEVAEMKVGDVQRAAAMETNEEIIASLDASEQMLSKR